MAGGKSFFALVLLGACLVLLGGLPEANAGIRFNEPFMHRGRGMHELGNVKEYDHKQGFEATLHFVSDSGNNTYGADINPLHLVVRVEKSTRLRVYLSDFSNSRWEVPHTLIPRQKIDSKLKDAKIHELAVSYTRKPFGFAVTRISTGDVLFNSTPPTTSAANDELLFNSLVFKDQYLEISTQLPAGASLYGLGESTRPDGLKLKTNHTYTLWATDIGSINLDMDLYGSYPFYLDVREGGLSHGVLLLNSNGMEITYNKEFLTYKVLGGVFDFYFFPGPTPLDVVDQFTQLVGRPAPQPYWSFGFHQCRWGYRNISMTRNVVENYKKAKIPLDTMWNDIDYMEKYKDFTADPVRFPLKELRSFVDELHANQQQYVIIVDPGIATAYKDYGTYLRGLEVDIYLKKQNGDNYLGQVWPGPVYFPDFLHPNSTEWWIKETQLFHDQIPFDGMWIDMNELANFCTGTSCTFNGTVIDDLTSCYLQCPDEFNHTKYDVPGFKINHVGAYEGLGYRTAAMTVKHYDGTLEYDAHNLYGLAESIATNKAMTLVRNKRPFVLSRSTFIGSGAHTAHWTGDNGATFNDLAYSIVTVLNSGILGIPMIGADICGFNDETTEDTCNRWIQVGAFHPFSRAHNNINNQPKELYLWKSVTVSAQKALGLRYRLLPYFYTLNYEAHKKGYPIVRPLFFAFPLDSNTLDVSYQFLIGNNILVSPVVTANTTSIEAYFPKGTWYNMFDWSKVVSKGENFTLDAPWDSINVHVHEGSIITLQDSGMTSFEVRKTPFTLVVSFPSDSLLSSASGYIFLDSGDDIDMDLQVNKSSLVSFKADFEGGNGLLKSKVKNGEYALKEGWIIDNLVLLGVKDRPTSFYLNRELIDLKVEMLADSGVYISGLGHLLGETFEFKWTL
ncbi:hypothetical protein M758_4G193600 [Ceratodon purpureus]|nr:hypothetical protein M758_4G193600 [Ceratodon purpureus]